MGIKRYKKYTIKKEIDKNCISKRNRNINYLCLLLILANLYLLPKYLSVSSEANKPKENSSVIENYEDNNEKEYEVDRINFISEGINIVSGDYKDKITDFQLVEDQLIISYKDEEGKIINEIDRIIEPSSFFKIMDIELLQDSNIRIRMVRADE